MQSKYLCLLHGVFKTFIFKIIINMLGLESTILLFVSSVLRSFSAFFRINMLLVVSNFIIVLLACLFEHFLCFL